MEASGAFASYAAGVTESADRDLRRAGPAGASKRSSGSSTVFSFVISHTSTFQADSLSSLRLYDRGATSPTAVYLHSPAVSRLFVLIIAYVDDLCKVVFFL